MVPLRAPLRSLYSLQAVPPQISWMRWRWSSALSRLPCSRCHMPKYCQDRKSTRLNSSHLGISYAVFCLKKKHQNQALDELLRENTRSVRAERQTQGELPLPRRGAREQQVGQVDTRNDGHERDAAGPGDA